MSSLRYPAWLLLPRPASGAFVQGFVASGLLATLQDQKTGKATLDRRALRIALQGGAALAAGTVAADAWRQQNLTRALTAVALGAASVAAIEHWVKENKENGNGQEKA